jgi:hypothetical protein
MTRVICLIMIRWGGYDSHFKALSLWLNLLSLCAASIIKSVLKFSLVCIRSIA